ncbi:MAG: hypothetical protein JW729_06745 [Bacteroidales bacterium]|nr:hypothetical protein [Bacteroidales bacterium]
MILSWHSRIFIGLISLLFVETSYSQAVDSITQLQINKTQAFLEVYQSKFDAYLIEMHSIDSLYRHGDSLYTANLEIYNRAKNAFKSLKTNYKAQLLPYQKLSKSKNRKEALEARNMMQLIKIRFQDNGKEAANTANFATREMDRAQKMMNRAKQKRDLLLPRFNQTLDQLELYEVKLKDLKESLEPIN